MWGGLCWEGGGEDEAAGLQEEMRGGWRGRRKGAGSPFQKPLCTRAEVQPASEGQGELSGLLLLLLHEPLGRARLRVLAPSSPPWERARAPRARAHRSMTLSLSLSLFS